MSAAPVGRGIHPIPRFATFLRFAPVVATLLVLFALSGDPAPGDSVLGRAVQQTPLGWMLANIGVFLAYPAVMFLVWCAGTASALRARNWPLVAAALLILLALSVNPILKEVVARPRPGAADLIIRRAAGGYGVPSGHTASATLMYGYAALSLALVTATPVRRLLVAAAGTAIAVIAFERVYDGAHWPSDVAAGSSSASCSSPDASSRARSSRRVHRGTSRPRLQRRIRPLIRWRVHTPRRTIRTHHHRQLAGGSDDPTSSIRVAARRTIR